MFIASEPLGALAGLPLHPLLVHSAVVLIPLVAVGEHAELGEIAPLVTLPMVALIYLRW